MPLHDNAARASCPQKKNGPAPKPRAAFHVSVKRVTDRNQPPALAEPLAEALALTDTLIEAVASTWPLIEAAKQPPTLSAALPLDVTTAFAPSSDDFTLASMPSSLPFMPKVTLSSAGRSFSNASFSFAAAAASTEPEATTVTVAGLHSSLALRSEERRVGKECRSR